MGLGNGNWQWVGGNVWRYVGNVSCAIVLCQMVTGPHWLISSQVSQLLENDIHNKCDTYCFSSKNKYIYKQITMFE